MLPLIFLVHVDSPPLLFPHTLYSSPFQSDLAAPFVHRLLLSFLARLPVPPRVPLYVASLSARQGVLRRVGSAAGGGTAPHERLFFKKSPIYCPALPCLNTGMPVPSLDTGLHRTAQVQATELLGAEWQGGGRRQSGA